MLKETLKKLSKLDWVLVSIDFVLAIATLVLEILNIQPYGSIVASVTGVYSLVCIVYYSLQKPKEVIIEKVVEVTKEIPVEKEVVKYVEKPAVKKTTASTSTKKTKTTSTNK